MKNRSFQWLTVLAVALLFATPSTASAADIAGKKWSGRWVADGGAGRQSVAIEFSDESGSKGTFTAPANMAFTTASVNKESSDVVIEAKDSTGKTYKIQGRLSDDEIRGSMTIGDAGGELYLTTSFIPWLEHTQLAEWIKQSDSTFAFPGILLLHTIGMAIVCGISAAIGLRILGLAREIPLSPLRKFFPLLWVGFTVNAITGTLLLYADIEARIKNPDFWVKLIFIALAVTNVIILKKRVFGDGVADERPLDSGSKALATTLIVFWIGAIAAGRLLAYLAPAGG